ncbi:MAG TPA: hypothetical protein VGN52_06530 [Burkholderiales bacterium]|jgi:hypothetical protein
MEEQEPGFYVAAYTADGSGKGVVFREFTELSGRWLLACRDFLRNRPASFDAAWQGELAHISARVTMAAGVALVTFKVRGTPAASVLLARGENEEAEAELVGMFIESLRRVKLVQTLSPGPEPFDSLRNLEERPLMVIVTWPYDEITEGDADLVQELSTHLAGAFLEGAAA